MDIEIPHRESLKIAATTFMIEIDILEKFKTLTIDHLNTMKGLSESLPHKPLILDFEVDLIRLAESSVSLYDKFVEFPAEARWIFQEALVDTLTSYFSEYVNFHPPCVQLMLSCKFFDNLTVASSIFAKSCSRLSAASRYILTSITIDANDTRQVETICVFVRCVDTGCPGYAGKYRSMEQLEIIEPDNYCCYCRKKYVEELSGRGEIHRVLAIFMPAEAFGQSEVGKSYKAITCSVTGSMIKELELGDLYDICGRYNDYSIYDVWGLKRVSFFYAPQELSISSCPRSIRALQESLSPAEKTNPWSFVRKLSLEFGSRMYRQNASSSLKLGLLMSLASLGNDRCAPILCVGSNVDILEEDVISYAAKCADRNVYVTFPIRSTIDKRGNKTWEHIGALSRAKTGVTYVGCWKMLKPSEQNDLLAVLDDECIAMEKKNARATTSRDMEYPPQPLPLKSAIWTYYSCKKYCGREKPDPHLKTLINLFGIPFYSDANDNQTPETFDEIIELVLNATVENGTPSNKVSQAEMIEFLRIVNAIEVTLNDDAANLMKDYFVACRRARPDVFPPKSMTFMTTLAEGHTRLGLRTEVTYDDVIAVIYLYEESMCYLYGFSVSTPPPFMNQGIDDIGHKMTEFKTWLISFLKCLV